MKPTAPASKKQTPQAVALVVIAILALFSWPIYAALKGINKPDTADLPNHTMPYVDGQEAVTQVESFYKQYTDPRSPAESRKKFVELYCNKNLTFYNQYYQHGFDPITCSTVMPQSFTTRLDSTGTSAAVVVEAMYPDNTTQTILATVALRDGMEIDSITCPGTKGALPPL